VSSVRCWRSSIDDLRPKYCTALETNLFNIAQSRARVISPNKNGDATRRQDAAGFLPVRHARAAPGGWRRVETMRDKPLHAEVAHIGRAGAWT
jgi:hypothetical protein